MRKLYFKNLPKISLYNWGKFSHTPTFGWYLTMLDIWLHWERPLYNESRLFSLFSFSYSKREGGITDGGMYWTGSTFTLHLFFMRIFRIKNIKKLEPLTSEDFE